MFGNCNHCCFCCGHPCTMLGVSLFISCKNKIQCVCVKKKKKETVFPNETLGQDQSFTSFKSKVQQYQSCGILTENKNKVLWQRKRLGANDLIPQPLRGHHSLICQFKILRVSSLCGSTPESDSVLIIWWYVTDHTKIVAQNNNKHLFLTISESSLQGNILGSSGSGSLTRSSRYRPGLQSSDGWTEAAGSTSKMDHSLTWLPGWCWLLVGGLISSLHGPVHLLLD